MPPVRTTPPMSSLNRPPKTERSHEENQERAYIAASRRSDRSLEARLESARRASEIHKKRTGRSLRVTEQDVINEEMYEEEDDEIPSYYRRLFPMAGMEVGGNSRLAAFLNQNQAIRQQFAAAIANSEPQQPSNLNQPWMQNQQQQQQNWQDNSVAPHMTHSRQQSYRQMPYTMPQQRPSPMSPTGIPSPQEPAKTVARTSQTPISHSPLSPLKQTPSLKQTPANTVFPEPMNSSDFANGIFSAQLPREAAMFLKPEYMNLNGMEMFKPQSASVPSQGMKPRAQQQPLHLSLDGMSQTLAPPDIEAKHTNTGITTTTADNNNYSWEEPSSAWSDPTFSPDNFDMDGFGNFDFSLNPQNTWDVYNNGGLPTPGEHEWSQFLDFEGQQDISSA